MKEKGNQYQFEEEAKSLYMRAFQTKQPKTKEEYNTLIKFADKEILEWEKFKSECIQRRNLIK